MNTGDQLGLKKDIISHLSTLLESEVQGQKGSAAVALVLRFTAGGLSALFVKRVEHPEDPWSGQIALPGGKREKNDKTLQDTAIRETQEEAGFNLHHCRFLGVLSPIISTPRPDMEILPLVYFCEKKPKITLNKDELEDYMWIPLNQLIFNRGRVAFPFGEFPAYLINNIVIWGVTYRILEAFLKVYTTESSKNKKRTMR